jgi:hypothetical protein
VSLFHITVFDIQLDFGIFVLFEDQNPILPLFGSTTAITGFFQNATWQMALF